MILIGIFAVIGIFLIVLGIWIQARAYGKHSIEVNAECIEVEEGNYKMGIRPQDYVYMRNTRRPVYRYWYNGQYYTSSPVLKSNRRGYQPKTGPCTIRINPDHPERVYSTERKIASILLIVIGSGYLIMVLLAGILFARFGLF